VLDRSARPLLGYFLEMDEKASVAISPGRCGYVETHLRDSLLVLTTEEYRPGDPTRVLALQEQ
jgi:hypothetical protein